MADHVWPGPRCAHCKKPRAEVETGEPCDGKQTGGRVFAAECGSGVIDMGTNRFDGDELPWEPGDVVEYRYFEPPEKYDRNDRGQYVWRFGTIEQKIGPNVWRVREPHGTADRVESRMMRRADHRCQHCGITDGMAHVTWCKTQPQPVKPPTEDATLVELEGLRRRLDYTTADRDRLARDCEDANKRAKAHSATIAELCDERARLIKRTEEAEKSEAGAKNARDALFVELLEFKKATMLDPPNDDYGRLTPDHLRQHIQDISDTCDKATKNISVVRDALQQWRNWSDTIAPPWGRPDDRSDDGQRTHIGQCITSYRKWAETDLPALLEYLDGMRVRSGLFWLERVKLLGEAYDKADAERVRLQKLAEEYERLTVEFVGELEAAGAPTTMQGRELSNVQRIAWIADQARQYERMAADAKTTVRTLQLELSNAWEHFDHKVDGQPFWSDRELNGGGERVELCTAIAEVLAHYRSHLSAVTRERNEAREIAKVAERDAIELRDKLSTAEHEVTHARDQVAALQETLAEANRLHHDKVDRLNAISIELDQLPPNIHVHCDFRETTSMADRVKVIATAFSGMVDDRDRWMRKESEAMALASKHCTELVEFREATGFADPHSTTPAQLANWVQVMKENRDASAKMIGDLESEVVQLRKAHAADVESRATITKLLGGRDGETIEGCIRSLMLQRDEAIRAREVLNGALAEIGKLCGPFPSGDVALVTERVQKLVEQLGQLKLADGTARADLEAQLESAHRELNEAAVIAIADNGKPMTVARRIEALIDERNAAARRAQELAEEMTRDVDAGAVAEIGMGGHLPDKTDLEDEDPDDSERYEVPDDLGANVIEDVIDRAADKLVARMMGDE